MKLLFCDTCCDVFKLDIEQRSCKCGKVVGRYVDNVKATSNGEGYSIAIGNGSLVLAIQRMKFAVKNKYPDREYFQDNCRIDYAWVRPNDGPGNPHMCIEEIE